MFSMPAMSGVPWQAMEGYSDDNPIHLHGETAERFRDLLAVFYALYVPFFHELAKFLDRLTWLRSGRKLI